MSEQPKTFRQLFELMDEPERSQAIENCEKQYQGRIDVVPEIETIRWAISSGFTWAETQESQGYDYWDRIHNKYFNR